MAPVRSVLLLCFEEFCAFPFKISCIFFIFLQNENCHALLPIEHKKYPPFPQKTNNGKEKKKIKGKRKIDFVLLTTLFTLRQRLQH